MNDDRTCEIHGSALQLMAVPVSYGLPVRDDLLIEARSKLFPNSFTSVLGGCCVGAVGDYSDQLVCLECREVEARWRKENGRDFGSKMMELFKSWPAPNGSFNRTRN